MINLGYFGAKMLYLVSGRNCEKINNFFRRKGVLIGCNTHIFSDISRGECFLIQIGDNVTISNNVSLITHDSSVSKYLPDKTDLFGKIIIGNNCFIGMNTTILPGVTITDNVIIAAGSVVSRSICESNVVYGGNPAKCISTFEQLARKNSKFALNIKQIDNIKEIINMPLIKR